MNVCNDFLGNENLLFQITENIVYNNYNMNHFDLSDISLIWLTAIELFSIEDSVHVHVVLMLNHCCLLFEMIYV